MARLVVNYAHPGHRFSRANLAMWNAARELEGITTRDLYATYPRFDIDIDREQALLLEHDVVVFQFPLFWYSTPSLVKEWQDLVLEHGFAYGSGGERLAGKTMMVALTAAGPEHAYTSEGYQRYPLRTFLTPLERTAGLCKMRFCAPYVLYGSLQCSVEDTIEPHARAYADVLCAIRDDTYDFDRADALGVVQAAQVEQMIKRHG